MVKKLALWIGVILLAVGVLGFVPGITSNNMLLGIFQVDAIHNIIHLVSGAIGIWASMTSMKASKMYFQVFGVIYAIVTVVGFLQGTTVLGLISVNMADNLLHLVIAAVSLYVGFAMKGSEMSMGSSTPMKPAGM